MNLAAIQQTIADDCGIDAHPNMTAIDRDRARKTSDLQTVIAFQWDRENNHPPDSPASRRQCARYVRQNVRRIKREQRQKQQDAIDSRTDDKCGFVFLLLFLEEFFSWLFGRWLDAWWDARNAINDPTTINAMLAEPLACAAVAECRAVDLIGDGDDDGDDETATGTNHLGKTP